MADGLGGVAEGFSRTKLPVRASVIPSTGGIQNHETGRQEVQTLCLLMPLDAPVAVGDGLCVDGDAPLWRCVEVQKWSAHVAVRAERIRGAAAV